MVLLWQQVVGPWNAASAPVYVTLGVVCYHMFPHLIALCRENPALGVLVQLFGCVIIARMVSACAI